MGKSAMESVTIVSIGVVLVAQLAQVVGYTISENDQQALVNIINSGLVVVTTGVSIVGSIVAIWGRVKATKQISGVFTPAPAPPLVPPTA